MEYQIFLSVVTVFTFWTFIDTVEQLNKER